MSKQISRFVRYVITDEFADGCGKRDPGDYASSLSADVLDTIICFDMSPCTSRPVWITIDVPADAAEGVYTSTLQLMAKGEKNRDFTITIEVLPQTLPAPAHGNSISICGKILTLLRVSKELNLGLMHIGKRCIPL